MNIGRIISQAIKEGKWLNINYLNKNQENTYYWIAIQDIDFGTRKLKIKMFNDKKSLNTFSAWIFFDNIKSAQIVNFSSYDVALDLITKIEKNLDKCKWLDYDCFNHNILNYYNECNLLDNDPSQKEYYSIPGIDIHSFKNNRYLALNDEQIKKIISDIYHYDLKNIGHSYYTLIINSLSIDVDKKKYVICYYELTFNPEKKSLIIGNKLRFNNSFLIDGRKLSLFNYINMNIDNFCQNYEANKDDYQKLIISNLKPGELINTRPEIMLIQREVPLDLSDTFLEIETKYKNNTLSTPLKSFFGNITKKNNIRRVEPSIIILDKKININQMRVLYNSLKYPVTYVQGPPGTGKTQTIINVVLSAFYNDKTVLVCSSNNKPVDGIVDKLQFEYNGDRTNFPFLRLGNYEDVKKATIKIKNLYNFSTNKVPKEELLNKIKVSNDGQNKKLISLLDTQEKRLDIENCLENSNRLINSFAGKSSQIINTVLENINTLKEDLKNYPEIDNNEITSLFTPLNENRQLSQFLYFKSLQYISKLKKPKYSELISICNIKDDNDRINDFNKWTQNDENMKKLSEVFPIIFSTNISSRRLGTPKFSFNLVIMDEAGQCNVATSLIPISKAESLLLVGDPNQLKPVIILDASKNKELMEKYNVPDKYDYKLFSILDVMQSNDNISKYILLKYHYRCGKKIIQFSNMRYYKNSLNLSYIQDNGNISILDVKNQNIKQRNEAYDEAIAIIDYIKRNNINDAFIITPFVNQKDLLKNLLSVNNLNNIGCGTIHSLQGAEKSTIILSMAISQKTSKKTFDWLKDNYELINVAITRAKNKLVIAADTEIINILSNKDDDLYNLIDYAKNNGSIEVPPNESVKIEIGKSNGSWSEDEFFKTISHFCSCHKTFEAERNVKISKLFKQEKNILDSKMEFDLVLYEKSYFRNIPVIIFEINGGEHLGNYEREKSDKLKMDICKKNNIKLCFIPNSFIKSYEYIADIILASKNKNTSIQQSLFNI